MGARDDFIQKAKSAQWTAAADLLNGFAMYDMLPAIAALGADRATAMQNIIGVFVSRNWAANADRLRWANEVVRTQSVPAAPQGLPGDQVSDAQKYLRGLKGGGAAPFDIEMGSPLRSGFTGGLGGPGQGDHSSTQWFIQYGMDLGCPKGAEVHAAFDGYVTDSNPHNPDKDSAHVYGAQIWIYSPNDKVGAFYTHFSDDDAKFAVRQEIKRGQLLGKIMREHLHFAINEFVGGKHVGVDLYRQFVDLRDTARQITVKFKQDGSPPTVG